MCHRASANIPDQILRIRSESSLSHADRLPAPTAALMAAGSVYYDPGVKVEHASTARPTHKGRSQFRVVSRDIDALYETVELVDL